MAATLKLLLIACVLAGVRGHGYLAEPPGRASAWRYGFDTPPDYTDNECFCGGFTYQYEVNDGKCGICGDPWDEEPPREHEVGSIYATGTLVRNYTQGQVITATSNVTANHLGHFEYKICPNNDVTVEATQECLDMYPLYKVGTEDHFLYIGDATGPVTHELQLPADLVCTQCVVQWRYVAGNNWGDCGNGTEGDGCGPQEEFRGCADVAIWPELKVEVVQTAVLGDDVGDLNSAEKIFSENNKYNSDTENDSDEDENEREDDDDDADDDDADDDDADDD